MKTKLLLLLAAFGLAGASAQAQLTTGDISFIGYRSDADDSLAFVTWVNIPSATSIFFTDAGFFNDGTIRDSEDVMTWTAPISGVSAGTVIVITSPDSGNASVNIGAVSLKLNGLSASGDQIFAGNSIFPDTGDTSKPGSTYSGTLLHGINFDGSTWAADTTNTNASALPSSLNFLYGNIAINEIDNAQYTGSRNFASVALAKAAVHNTANWSTDDAGSTITSLSSTAFAIPEPSSIILVGVMGLAGLLVLRRKKK